MKRQPRDRQRLLGQLGEVPYDVLVIGGGINGAVVAASLAARGAKVAVVDRGDFAGQTSMQSSNLAWGGIKYLESFEFGLVRRLCRARNQLMRAYPSSVQEMRFLASVPPDFRLPRWILYMGAWLYWFIGGMFTSRPRWFSRRSLQATEPALDITRSSGGFEYADAHLVDSDARFVFGFIKRAMDYGALAVNYVEAFASEKDGTGWVTRLRDVTANGIDAMVRSRVLINTCGPYADEFNRMSGVRTQHRHLLSKGIHLIVRSVVASPRVLAFFASDGRLFFVIPMGSRSCIGTTDTRTTELPPRTTDADRNFVLENINRLLALPTPLTTGDIIAERCGVRPLVVAHSASENGASENGAEWTSLSRKHVIEVDRARSYVTVFGGKLTDCLNVGEEVALEVTKLGVELHSDATAWFGEPPEAERIRFLQRCDGMKLARPTSERLWRYHGTAGHDLIGLIEAEPRLGAPLLDAADVLLAEAVYAADVELVVDPEDFLRRRTLLAQTVPSRTLESPELRARLIELLQGTTRVRVGSSDPERSQNNGLPLSATPE
jgi:glycerol-3-phosphate dehydrogenase